VTRPGGRRGAGSVLAGRPRDRPRCVRDGRWDQAAAGLSAKL